MPSVIPHTSTQYSRTSGDERSDDTASDAGVDDGSHPSAITSSVSGVSMLSSAADAVYRRPVESSCQEIHGKGKGVSFLLVWRTDGGLNPAVSSEGQGGAAEEKRGGVCGVRCVQVCCIKSWLSPVAHSEGQRGGKGRSRGGGGICGVGGVQVCCFKWRAQTDGLHSGAASRCVCVHACVRVRGGQKVCGVGCIGGVWGGVHRRCANVVFQSAQSRVRICPFNKNIPPPCVGRDGPARSERERGHERPQGLRGDRA
eukprot:365689-Chlamydomonas_euryale.AAC.4